MVSTRSVAVAPFGKPAVEPEADDFRDQHDQRLSQHGRLGLDAAHTPAHDPQPVDHGRVGICAHQRVGVRQGVAVGLPGEDHLAEEFQVDLMDDARVRRNHAEVVEGLLPPAQERVPFAVALVLKLRVGGERLNGAEVVHLHGVVDDQVHGLERVDASRVAAQPPDALPHGRQIHDGGHPGEVLQQDARRHEGDFLVRLRRRIPPRQRPDVRRRHVPVVLAPEQVLQQDLEGERQPVHRQGGLLGQGFEPVDLIAVASDVQGRRGVKRVDAL